MQQSPRRWLAHSPMTEPADLAVMVERLPSDVPALNRVVQGLVIHGDWLDRYGADANAFGTISRATLPIRQRLAALIERDGRGLDECRVPTQREVGTCRDFALMLCAFLRAQKIPARVRCGFASYLGDGWEDHWVCEYWNDRASRWFLSDAQLDDVIGAACNIHFNTADVPRNAFLTAADAWLRCRSGNDDPSRFGQGSVRGVWFMMVDLVRDTLALNHRETSSWDRWREASPESRTILSQELALLDKLARNPERTVAALTPPWLSDEHPRGTQ